MASNKRFDKNFTSRCFTTRPYHGNTSHKHRLIFFSLMVICMELCKICPLKICLSSKDCDCGLRESKKSLDVKISVEGNLTVITGESVRAALQKWKKRAILKELKSKCHTNGWVDDDKAIYLKGKHEHKIIIQTLQPFFIFWFCNTCYTQKCLKYLKYVLHICQNIY